MFNGIVETTGRILEINMNEGCKEFLITPHVDWKDIQLGESIAVNGVCLTVTKFENNYFSVTVVPETLRKTNLDHCRIHDAVNLERALKLSARISGHYVQGHVDGVGKIMEMHNDHSAALLVKISIPQALSRYCIAKGFIALDGMSITLIQAEMDWITVTFIPHTQQVTIISQYKIGSLINIEVDMMAKYIQKSLEVYHHANTH